VTTVDEVLELYDRWGGGRYDEAVAQLDHALQTAALATAAGAPEPLIAAALLHDVGHLLELRDAPAVPSSRRGATDGPPRPDGSPPGDSDRPGRRGPTDAPPWPDVSPARDGDGGPAGAAGGGRGRHEVTGPAFLTGVFPEVVTGPIGLHVAAKRYLCAVEPAYVAGLSAGSVRSLRRQGGPMSADEVTAFEAMPGGADAVALRRWDDAGKVDGAVVPGLSDYESLLRSLAC